MIDKITMSIVQRKNDFTVTEKALLADKMFLAELEKDCAIKTAEWEEIVKQADELAAFAETIKVLDDDDTLELSKKTLPIVSTAIC